MGPLGWQETVFIFVLALLVFGPKKLPELGRNLAKALGEFRRASSELKDTWHREMSNIERETQDIKNETQKIGELASGAADSSYNYDSSYDYGAYGYPDSYDNASSTAETTAAAETAGAAAIEGDSATVEGSETGAPASPEGVVAQENAPGPSGSEQPEADSVEPSPTR
jgi:TatA/E family protein of Tat protein translocase